MRVRPVPLLLAVFGSAAAVTVLVVRQLPREGDVSPPAQAPVAAAPAETSPSLDPPATAADGVVEVRVTAGAEPQRGAQVRLYVAPDSEGAPWRRAGEARTDRDGTARLHARPGAHLVAARAPGLAPGIGEVVAPRSGEVARVSLALEPPAALSGQVTLRGGEPGARARVRAVPARSAWLDAPSAPPEESALVETRAGGAFRIDGLAPGLWAVSVEAAGHHRAVVPHAPVPGAALDVSLEPLGLAEGRVLYADGRPAADALVRVTSPEHAATARSRADGRFTIPAPGGSYALTASLGDEAGAARAAVAIAPGATTAAPALRLGPAATLHGAVVRPGRSGGGRAARLVRPRHARGRRARGRRGRRPLRAHGLAPGAYDVRARAATRRRPSPASRSRAGPAFR
jgi:hypothetical protein